MKKLIKLFLTIAFTIIFSVSAFAESGAEFILSVPIGGSYSIISESMKDVQMKNSFGLDAGVNAQFGGMFQVKEGFGLSVLADIGYSHDNYKIKYEENHLKDYYFRYDSIQVGLLSKINLRRFSIGIGGGIKFPIYVNEDYNYLNVARTLASSYIANNENDTSDEDNEWYDHVYDYFVVPPEQEPYSVIPYAKLTLDYYIFIADKLAVNIGLYCRYDFLPKHNFYNGNAFTVKPKNYGTLNFGVQLGLRFGPRA